MRSSMFSGLILLIILSLCPTLGWASNEHPARKMWATLELTPEQEAKFRDINSRYAPARKDHVMRIEELREKINVELAKPTPSRSLLIQYAGHIGEIQKKMSVASVDQLLSVKAVLTPEQFKKFTDMVPVGGSGTRNSRRSASDSGGGE